MNRQFIAHESPMENGTKSLAHIAQIISPTPDASVRKTIQLIMCQFGWSIGRGIIYATLCPLANGIIRTS